jgi:hypothetical protein
MGRSQLCALAGALRGCFPRFISTITIATTRYIR